MEDMEAACVHIHGSLTFFQSLEVSLAMWAKPLGLAYTCKNMFLPSPGPYNSLLRRQQKQDRKGSYSPFLIHPLKSCPAFHSFLHDNFLTTPHQPTPSLPHCEDLELLPHSSSLTYMSPLFYCLCYFRLVDLFSPTRLRLLQTISHSFCLPWVLPTVSKPSFKHTVATPCIFWEWVSKQWCECSGFQTVFLQGSPHKLSCTEKPRRKKHVGL